MCIKDDKTYGSLIATIVFLIIFVLTLFLKLFLMYNNRQDRKAIKNESMMIVDRKTVQDISTIGVEKHEITIQRPNSLLPSFIIRTSHIITKEKNLVP